MTLGAFKQGVSVLDWAHAYESFATGGKRVSGTLGAPDDGPVGIKEVRRLESGKRLGKLLEDRKISVVLDPKAREWLADKGYDPAYGARPLKRAIQKAVQDPLAELILSGKIKDGEKVSISAGKQGLTFNGQVAEAA